MFRDDFVWGIGSSAYQIEGMDPNDGRGECIWDRLAEEQPEKVCGDKATVACDHMHKYPEDYKLMASLGIKNNRFSINWSRILPNGTGEINQKGIDMYRDMIKEMKANGIEPYITLYHWDLPQALEDKGGWVNPEIVDWFTEYAKVIAENFSDVCDKFFTINEPQCVIGLGYVCGDHAPGKCLSNKETFQAAHNLLKCHGSAVRALRKYSCRPVKVGFAPTCTIPMPVSNKEEDIEAARLRLFTMEDDTRNWAWNVPWFCDPVLLGKYPEQGVELFKEYLPEITEEDMKLISEPIDFVGFNIYNGYYMKSDGNGGYVGMPFPTGLSQTSVGWGVQEQCLYWGVKFLYERYKTPIFITENGMACCDWVSLDGKVHDPARIDFLDRYLSALNMAIEDGADVLGYFLWTFMDNYEWEKGYHGRFGICYTDFKTLERTPKDSAYWYKTIMESNGKLLTGNRENIDLFKY